MRDLTLGPGRPRGTDLSGLLAERRGPERELPLTLQVRRLAVEGPHRHHVAVERLELRVGERLDHRQVAFGFGRRVE